MADYERGQVEALLCLLFDPHRCYGLVVETRPDADMPKGPSLRGSGGGWLAELADIGRAWDGAGLTRSEKRRLLLYFGLGFTFAEAGRVEGVDERRVRDLCDRGVAKILRFLNGR